MLFLTRIFPPLFNLPLHLLLSGGERGEVAKGDKGGFKIVSPFHKRRCKRDFYLYEKSTPALL